MKKSLFLGLILVLAVGYAQPNTEVFLLDFSEADGKISLSNLRNISKNIGYDNQPSFYDDNSILFSSTRNGQTDIAKYDIPSEKVSWLTDTPGGSEYSPLRIPESDDVSAIRLDTNGLQRLYRYKKDSGQSELVREDAKVGYHIWYSKDVLVNTILVDNRMDLVLSNFKDETNAIVHKNVGRSLHKIPNTEFVSFLSEEGGFKDVKSLDLINGQINALGGLPKNINDICWLPDGRLIYPSGKSIVGVHPESAEKPKTIHLFQEGEINNISRMAVSPDGKYLAIVSEESPAKIVQKQVDSYNAGDLEAFVNCYAENVIVRNFPADTLYVGHEKMRTNYSGLSPENKVYQVEVVDRIVIGNQVIDREKVTSDGKFQQMQVALYEVNNGKISSMTFIFDDENAVSPETIVQKQLDVYNQRDIEGFLETYTEDVKLYNFPAEKTSEGQAEMRRGYAGFFKNTPDLNCKVKKRIVIANKVIDEEYITANGNNFSAVAIYEVENGKIAKVTFLR